MFSNISHEEIRESSSQPETCAPFIVDSLILHRALIVLHRALIVATTTRGEYCRKNCMMVGTGIEPISQVQVYQRRC